MVGASLIAVSWALLVAASLDGALAARTQVQQTGAERRRRRASASGTQVKCSISGPRGEVASFPVEKCHFECVKAGNWEGVGAGGNMRTIKAFSMAFTVSLQGDKCLCSNGGEGLLQFKPINAAERRQCQGDKDLAKKRCFEFYKKGRSLELTTQTGAEGKEVLIARYYLERYRQSKFTVDKTCAPCEGDACNEVVLPSMFEGLSDEMLAKFNDLMEDVEAGGASSELVELADMITNEQKQELQCKKYNGKTLEDLKRFHPSCPVEGLTTIAERAGISETGRLDCEKAQRFRDLLADPGCAVSRSSTDWTAAFAGMAERDRKEIMDALANGWPVLKPGDIDDRKCAVLKVGAYECKANAVGSSGDSVCRCNFMGAKSMTCDNLYGNNRQAFFILQNQRVGVFGKQACQCQKDPKEWTKSRCDLGVTSQPR